MSYLKTILVLIKNKSMNTKILERYTPNILITFIIICASGILRLLIKDDMIFSILYLVILAVMLWAFYKIESNKEKKEQENEERIRNIIKEELENLTLKNNPIKTTEKVDEKGEK